MVSNQKHEVCLVCGRATPKVICELCARKLTEEATHLHNKREQEKLHDHRH